jgi:hypothetical protein
VSSAVAIILPRRALTTEAEELLRLRAIKEAESPRHAG